MEPCRENLAELQELLLSKYGKISNYLNKFGFSVMDKGDVLQDTFIVAYKNLGGLRETEKLEPWLKKIAENTALYYIKKSAKEAVPSAEIEFLAENSAFNEEMAAADVCSILERDENNCELLELLDKLPEKYYTVVRLRYVQEYSLQETAQIMGINYNTAKTLHARALKKLREIIVGQGRVANGQ